MSAPGNDHSAVRPETAVSRPPLVERAHLRGGDGAHHDPDEQRQQQRERAAEAGAAVPLRVLVHLHAPHRGVEAERDGGQQDRDAGGHLSGRAGAERGPGAAAATSAAAEGHPGSVAIGRLPAVVGVAGRTGPVMPVVSGLVAVVGAPAAARLHRRGRVRTGRSPACGSARETPRGRAELLAARCPGIADVAACGAVERQVVTGPTLGGADGICAGPGRCGASRCTTSSTTGLGDRARRPRAVCRRRT